MSIAVPRFIAAGGWLAVLAITVLALTVACNQPDTLLGAEPTATSFNGEVQPTATSVVAPTINPLSPTPTSVVAPTSSPLPPTVAATRAATPTSEPDPTPVPLVALKVIDGSKARYLTKEQFASRNLPNDAVGETKDVSGTIVLDENGVVQPQEPMAACSGSLRSVEYLTLAHQSNQTDEGWESRARFPAQFSRAAPRA